MPDFIVLGAPKCGTTSLYEYLKRHPNVYMPTEKEPHYYADDFSFYRKIKTYRDYKRLFDHGPGVVSGEASVWYLYSKKAVVNILAEEPGAKFLVMLRNPYEMAVSLHNQLLYSGREDVVSFDDAWFMQHKRKSGEEVPKGVKEVSHLLYASACSLGDQVSRLYNNVDRAMVKVIFLDDLKSDPEGTMEEVFKFLGLESSGPGDYKPVNEAKAHRNVGLYKALRGFSFLFKPASALARKLFPNSPRSFLEPLYNLNSVKARKYSPRVETLHSMAEVFEDQITIIEDLEGRDLTHWRMKR